MCLKEPMHAPHAYITIQHACPSSIYNQLNDVKYKNHFNAIPYINFIPTYIISHASIMNQKIHQQWIVNHELEHQPCTTCSIYHIINHMQIYTISMKYIKEPMHSPHAYATIQHEYASTIYNQLKDKNHTNRVMCLTRYKNAPHSTKQPSYTISKYQTNHSKYASSIHHIMTRRNHKNNYTIIPIPL